MNPDPGSPKFLPIPGSHRQHPQPQAASVTGQTQDPSGLPQTQDPRSLQHLLVPATQVDSMTPGSQGAAGNSGPWITTPPASSSSCRQLLRNEAPCRLPQNQAPSLPRCLLTQAAPGSSHGTRHRQVPMNPGFHLDPVPAGFCSLRQLLWPQDPSRLPGIQTSGLPQHKLSLVAPGSWQSPMNQGSQLIPALANSHGPG